MTNVNLKKEKRLFSLPKQWVIGGESFEKEVIRNCYLANDFSKTITQESFLVSLARVCIGHINNPIKAIAKALDFYARGKIYYYSTEKLNIKHDLSSWGFVAFKDCPLSYIEETAKKARLNPHWVSFVNKVSEYNNLDRNDIMIMSVVTRDDGYFVEQLEKHNKYLKDMNVHFEKIKSNIAGFDKEKSSLTGKFERSMTSLNKWAYLNDLKKEMSLENLVYIIDGEWEKLINNHKNDFYIARIKDSGRYY